MGTTLVRDKHCLLVGGTYEAACRYGGARKVIGKQAFHESTLFG
jgi:hypothetical protein